LDALGRLGGLAIAWNTQTIQVINTWGMDSGLGITVLALELREDLHILNVYGPYQNIKPYGQGFCSESYVQN
jgi:hypothetical protein